jgi:hypothetical protein
MNINELLLQKLVNDPNLLKRIEKMVKANPTIIKEKKLKSASLPKYVNKVHIKCKLCATIETIFIRMDWDNDDKIYRNGCYSVENYWPDLPMFEQHQRKPSCKLCPSVLSATFTKEELIRKLIVQSEVFYAKS